MDYVPLTAVWEITVGCNMRCGHCGSTCTDARSDELTTAEALQVCDDMQALGMKWITLSGGEPLTRKDWPELAKRLSRNGIIPNIITNGWLVDDAMVKRADECGVATVSISLDGDEATHDAIRKPSSYARVINAFDALHRHKHTSAANTTVTKQNIHLLGSIKETLIRHRVDLWQIQIGLPMGNLAKQKGLVLEPDCVDLLLDFCFKTASEGQIKVFPADCLGYYTSVEGIIRQASIGTAAPVVWQGCNAGKRSFGLLHNGDVVGCTSIRDPEFIEGNIRQRRLTEIWRDPARFVWSRNLTRHQLKGECQSCCYGDLCLGGCPNTRLTMNRTIYSENEYCAYRLSQIRVRRQLAQCSSRNQLLETARAFVGERQWQLAATTLERALELDETGEDLLELYGFVCFALGNFATARDVNGRLVAKNPLNAYGHKGLGLSLHRLRESERGITHLVRATELASPDNLDAFHDLSVVYGELGRYAEARSALERAELLARGRAVQSPMTPGE